MKYKQRDELVASLRELANFVEARGIELPELDVWASAHVSDYHPGHYEKIDGRAKRVMKQAARAFGRCEKHHYGSTFELRRKFGVIEATVSTTRENVCRKIVKGTVEKPEQIIPAHTEEVVEWICDEPLLVG